MERITKQYQIPGARSACCYSAKRYNESKTNLLDPRPTDYGDDRGKDILQNNGVGSCRHGRKR